MRKYSWKELFVSSYGELRHAGTMTVCALMGAAAIVLGSLSIYVTDTIRIGFSGIPQSDCSLPLRAGDREPVCRGHGHIKVPD